MKTYRISGDAWGDLRAIADFILKDNPERSESFVIEITEKFAVIAERPLSFPARDEWLPGLRSALHGKYVILFEIDGEVAHIRRVLHGARNIASLFNS